MKQYLPQFKNKNIFLFYILTALNNAFFMSGNWIFFWTRFMSYSQLGIIDASSFAFGVITEVPSGAVADLIGKKKTIIISMFFAFLGFLMISSANNLFPIFLGFLLANLGWSLYSGSAEALAYDSLVEKGKEKHYEKVISVSNSIALFSAVIAVLTGGIMYTWHFRLPHYAFAFSYFLACLIALFLREPKIDTEKFSWSAYWKQIVDGTKHLFQEELRRYLPMIFVVSGVYFLYSWGFIRPAIAISFGFMDKAQAVINSVLMILVAIAIFYIPVIRKKISDLKVLAIFTLLLGLGFFSASFPIGYYGFFTMLIIAVSGNLITPWTSIIVNRKIASKYRATTLSALALIIKIPYVLVAVLAGQLVEQGLLSKFNLSLSLLIFIVLIFNISLYFLKKRRNNYHINTTK